MPGGLLYQAWAEIGKKQRKEFDRRIISAELALMRTLPVNVSYMSPLRSTRGSLQERVLNSRVVRFGRVGR